MGTIAGQEIIDQARIILQDTTSGSYRWSDSELFGWLNDGQRAVVKLKPDVNTTIATVSPTADSTEQEIPTG